MNNKCWNFNCCFLHIQQGYLPYCSKLWNSKECIDYIDYNGDNCNGKNVYKMKMGGN